MMLQPQKMQCIAYMRTNVMRCYMYLCVTVIDAMGKPETAVLSGNFRWLGDYDECIGIRASINKSGAITHPWKGQYCTANFKLAPVGKVCKLFYTLV